MTSGWPRVTLDSRRSIFTSELRRAASEAQANTGLALLAPIVPRLYDFALRRVGPRADAVGSTGDFLITFEASQRAFALSIATRVDRIIAFHGVNLSNASVSVSLVDQVLKDVQVIRDSDRLLVLALAWLSRPLRPFPFWRLRSLRSASRSSVLAVFGPLSHSPLRLRVSVVPSLRSLRSPRADEVLAMEIARETKYSVALSGVANPGVAGVVLWTVQTLAPRLLALCL